MRSFWQDKPVCGLYVDGIYREFVVIARSRGLHPLIVYTADGICLEPGNGHSRNPAFTKMGDVNGINAAAEQYGFVAVHLLPLRRWAGLVSGWNTKGGLLRYDPCYDDLKYVDAVVRKIDSLFRHSQRIFVGFGAGAQFGHIVLNYMPNVFRALVSVSGTILGTEGRPPGGASFIGFHGTEDDTFPFRGGLPRSLLRHAVMQLALAKDAALSNPAFQEIEYATANRFSASPTKEGRTPVGVRRQYHADGSHIRVVAYRQERPWGGHTYHGRAPVESWLSPGNGRPAPADLYSINNLWASDLGLQNSSF